MGEYRHEIWDVEIINIHLIYSIMKQLFFPLIFFAAAISSCSNDQPNVGTAATSSGDLVAINVYTGTSRASDTFTSTLEYSGEVLLHINDSVGLNVTYLFEYDGTDWSQSSSSPISWDDINFPANFYSLHDGTDALTAVSFDDVEAIYTDYTVTGASTEHKDLVTHASILSTIPVGGAVSVYHKHALSKIHLLASTGTNSVYIANAQLMTIDGMGNVTIVPLSADEIASESGISWDVSESEFEDYLYLAIGEKDTPDEYNSTDYGSNPLINDSEDAPLMIIPQTTTAATVSSSAKSVATFENSYVQVIYYMTDSEGMPVVGYSSVAARSDANDFIQKDQTKALYVLAAFPLGYTFEPNKEYNVTLGLGVDGSTGGILIADYYVDYKGDAVELTRKGDDDAEKEDVSGIDEGDNILGDSDSDICILVTANSWNDDTDAVSSE